MKKHGKLPKKLQEWYDKKDYFCPPNHKMLGSSIVPNADEYSILEPLLRHHSITHDNFEKIMLNLFEKVKNIMLSKANQYNENPSDRFNKKKKSSTLTKISPVRTLYGMWVKHIISLSDMVSSEKQYPRELWEEKIIDNINYLLLLAGAIKEFDLIEKK